MTRTLSMVSPQARAQFSGFSLHNKPALGSLVGAAIALSAEIDHDVGLLLARIIGAEAAPALAMYEALRADHVRKQALTAAARAALTREQFRVFEAVLTVSESAQKERHRLAHWIWGECPELPQALLLADPKYLRKRAVERMKPGAVRDLRKDGAQNTMNRLLYEIDRSCVLVYEEDDLQEICLSLADVDQILSYFGYYLSPVISLEFLSEARPLKEFESSEEMLRLMCNKRVFREAYGVS